MLTSVAPPPGLAWSNEEAVAAVVLDYLVPGAAACKETAVLPLQTDAASPAVDVVPVVAPDRVVEAEPGLLTEHSKADVVTSCTQFFQLDANDGASEVDSDVSGISALATLPMPNS